MFPFLAPLALLSQMVAESAGPGAGLPTLSELAAEWQTVKTCNHRGPRRVCGAANVTAKACADRGRPAGSMNPHACLHQKS
jgi:hypothetical protein